MLSCVEQWRHPLDMRLCALGVYASAAIGRLYAMEMNGVCVCLLRKGMLHLKRNFGRIYVQTLHRQNIAIR